MLRIIGSQSDEDKLRAITKKKNEIKKNIFRQYGFIPLPELPKAPLPKF